MRTKNEDSRERAVETQEPGPSLANERRAENVTMCSPGPVCARAWIMDTTNGYDTMPEPRKSAKQSAARERARTQAAQFREREDTLESLAVDYFTYVEQVDEVKAQADSEVERVRAQAEVHVADRQRSADAVIARMLKLGTPRNEIADRLGISTRDVKRATPTPAAATDSAEPETANGTPGQ